MGRRSAAPRWTQDRDAVARRLDVLDPCIFAGAEAEGAAAGRVAHDVASDVLLGPLPICACDLLPGLEDAHPVLMRGDLAGALQERMNASLRSWRER